MKTIAIIVVAICLSACATAPQKGRPVGKATTTPLHDLNLTSIAIAPVLLDARTNPYAMPAALTCDALAADILSLDEVLGPDIDAAVADSSAGDMVGDAATNALQGMLDRILPFRNWIRKLSGAEQEARHATACIAAGNARRAFLKGVSQAQACPASAAVLAER
jgi:hypothetical protein